MLPAALAPARPLLRVAADALWPPRCWLCGAFAPGGATCPAHVLPAAPGPPRCDRCAAPLARVLPDGARCPDCRRRPPAFRSVVALGAYREGEPLREWVLAFKHGGRRDLAPLLGAALAARLARATANDEPRWGSRVVPVPLHAWRRVERGHDQAALLAREIARSTELTLERTLVRRRATLPQGTAGAVSRRANVEGAFRVRRSARAAVAGRDVWLVDDVLTSGATASACARALRAAGARRVDVLVLARASSGAATLPPP